MADVFLARDQLLDRPVAVKVLFPQYAAEPTFVARFRREAQAAANLNHPSVVAVYDWGAHEDTYFIVMEYVEGRSLADVLAAEGHLYPDRAAEIATDVVAALGFAHRNGTVHRDVKPGNIMITHTGQVKVTDFGIARAFGGDDDELTQTGSVMGTASYFSPEQAQGKQVDPRSDLYSLGVVLFEMVTGEPPFTGASPVSIAYKHVQEQPQLASALNPAVPQPLDAIISRLLAKNPDDRYPSAEEVRADLRRFREGQPLVGVGRPAASMPVEADRTAAMAVPTAATHAVRARTADSTGARAVIDTTRAIPASAAARQVEAVEEYYEPPSRTGVFMVMLAGLLLLTVGIVFYIANTLSQGDDETATADVDLRSVPGVIGETDVSATNTLENAGFIVVKEFEENADVEPGTVFDQQPDRGEEVEEGSEVTIFISAAPDTVDVPDVVGQTEDEAVRILNELGLLVKRVPVPSDTVPEGEVISQSLIPGQSVNPSTEIELEVSSGPEQILVPEVAGLDLNAASNELGRAGISSANFSIVREPSATVPEGSVIRTDPPAGSEIAVAQLVTIYVSTGADNVAVPPLIGLTQQAGESLLRDNGFNVRIEFVPVDPNAPEVGNIVTQTPDAGQVVPIGSEVLIRVGQATSTTTTQPATTTTSTTTTTTTTTTVDNDENAAGT